MKKLIGFIVVAIVIVILVVNILYMIPVAFFSYIGTWKYTAEYEAYADEFHLVKDYFIEAFPEESDRSWLISNYKDQGIRVYDANAKAYVSVPGEVRAALDTIDRCAFSDKDSDFDRIRIQEGRISFGIANHRYALVFSPEQKPTWVNSPNEKFDSKIKSIGQGWYHVVRDPG